MISAHLRRFLNLVGVAAAAAVITGCTTHKQTARVDFHPSVNQPIQGQPKATVRIAPIQDVRPRYDKSEFVNVRTGHGRTTSAVVAAEEPIAEIFRGGLVEALEQNSFQVAPTTGMYELRGSIQQLDFSVVTDFWGATGKPYLQVHFELINKFSGNSVWEKTYVGAQSISTPWSANQTMVKLFNQSADDVITQLISDESFRRYFEAR